MLSSQALKWFLNATVYLVLLQLCGVVNGEDHQRHAHRHQHQHEKYHHRDGASILQRANRIANSTGNGTDAFVIVSQALQVLAMRNKQRLEHIQFNKYEFGPVAELQSSTTPAPPLDYSAGALSNITKRQLNSTQEQSYAYSIPPELLEAARIVAEASPQSTSAGNHSVVAAEMKAKYSTKLNDTNFVAQAHIQPDGLSEYVPTWEHTRFVSNQTENEKVLENRATSTYWMAKIEQRGLSPFAPAGYKVWRNVMDYGAKGNGVADDTAAINRAISDGNRCGDNCGSSTIHPAVIWFPSGTYLVSTPIIQYYNTQFLGDPLDVPTILAASSFVGLGVITSDVYTGATQEWYLNTNNFLRSVRNFKIDITQTNLYAEICAIHWQVAQGTNLENIEFYMSTAVGTTQQGIYMENGSGGFLSDLTFVGGKFGAYFGNQQFTTSHLIFVNCQTALQVHWDWAWTMQEVVIESCGTGIVIVGGAGGPLSTGQGVGSLVLVDAIIANTPTGIVTSLYSENSTSLLLQNVGFFNVGTAILENTLSRVLLAGGNEVLLDSWGFGMLNDPSGSRFVNGQNIPMMNRTAPLLSSTLAYVKSNLFTRRRAKYYDLGNSQVIDVKSLGAKGDGTTDDTAILNSILAAAANMSSIVFFPFGVYIVQDTLKIPTGSRIIGQAWSQIMAKGPKFEDASHPKVVVQVGNKGDSGVIEIQDMMFTVSGPTAGAVLMEWNTHESSQGSSGLWDSHFRVGGAIGSNLQRSQCPKLSGSVNPRCIAASLLLHLTPQSSAYLENVWVWVADHDLDIISQDQIDVYAARGVLVESQGPTWLYGTASEHCVLYQYQFSNAKNALLGMIQTESPYFQAAPQAPAPFPIGLFANDPTFEDCTSNSNTCAVSWAVRIIDSSSIFFLGAGIYSWFSKYSQDCLTTENCQERAFEIEESSEIWLYNIVTKAVVEMVSPVDKTPTYARDNKNGFLSSILAWIRRDQTIGGRNFPGFHIYDLKEDEDSLGGLPEICKTALTQVIKCDSYVQMFRELRYRGSLHNDTLTESVCDPGCDTSLKSWFDTVTTSCIGYNVTGTIPTRAGGIMWAGRNETCLKDKTTAVYCNELLATFEFSDLGNLPQNQLCSFCNVAKIQLMQSNPYSTYDKYYKTDLEFIHSKCDTSGPTEVPPPLVVPEPSFTTLCTSDLLYTTKDGDTCDSIALAFNVSSAALYMGNDLLYNCKKIATGTELCMPLQCQTTYELQKNDTCTSIEIAKGLSFGNVRKFNTWLTIDCTNLQVSNQVFGNILCLSLQGGEFTATATIPGATLTPGDSTGYTNNAVAPPINASVALGTTLRCGKWHVAEVGESCTTICVEEEITIALFLEVNPSLSATNCASKLDVGSAYCAGPVYGWSSTEVSMTDMPTTSSSLSSSSTSVSSLTSSSSRSSTSSSTSTTSTPSPSVVPVGPEFAQIGCYTDLTSARTLSTDITTTIGAPVMTVSKCLLACQAAGFHFAGLEYAHQCWCGNTIDHSGLPAPGGLGDCNMRCDGNSSETCGGSNRLSLYSVPRWVYRGCFTDSTTKRSLPTQILTIPNASTNMTIEKCTAACRTANFTFAGLEYAQQCFCGSSTGTGTVATESTCNMACKGNATQMCGGSNRLSVYSLYRIWTAIGCYTDSGNPATLGTQVAISNHGNMTVPICQAACEVAGYSMAGVEGGSDCWCGNQRNAGSVMAWSSCSTACTGDSTQKCGGTGKMNIYLFS